MCRQLYEEDVFDSSLQFGSIGEVLRYDICTLQGAYRAPHSSRGRYVTLENEDSLAPLVACWKEPVALYGVFRDDGVHLVLNPCQGILVKVPYFGEREEDAFFRLVEVEALEAFCVCHVILASNSSVNFV